MNLKIKCWKCHKETEEFDSLSESHDMCTSCYDEQIILGHKIAYTDEESNEEIPDFEKIAVEDEFERLAKKQADAREGFMKKQLRKHLKWYDKPLFYFYRKLADRFGGGQRVITLQERDHLDGTRSGIKIYGEEY